MNCATGKRLQLSRVLFLLSGVFLCTLYQLTIRARLYEPLPEGSAEEVEEKPLTTTHDLEPTDQTTPEMHVVNYLDTTSDLKASTPSESPPLPIKNQTTVHCIYVAPEPPQETPTPAPAPPVTTIPPASPGEAPHVKGEYPEDVFSIEERRRGWVILHIIGMMYMFVSLAVVCDEFFVPALGVITDKLAISDDVAGATFMAAGRSAPRFFAYLIGVFIAHRNVGIGTKVGSAIFNILFVIGMCALFSREVLHLTWWPLFRDVSFYILDLILLIIFFLDNVIMWWESIVLMASYTFYVIFMKFNVQIERAFKTQLHKHKSIVKVIAVEEPEEVSTTVTKHCSCLKSDGFNDFSVCNESLRAVDMPAGEDGPGGSEDSDNDKVESDKDSDESSKNESDYVNEEKTENEPLSLQWPDTRRKQATYLFLLPIVFPLWLTLPDVRNQKSRKFFMITFVGSIPWIAVFSYLIVWWAHRIGETIGISHHIMTVLAAETSIPDLITSVIVARKGQGDMAVSSCVGSNIFDITVGLPVPWFLYSSFHDLAPVVVSSNGLLFAIMLVFLMLLFVIIISSCKWKMNKVLGFIMLLLYFIFLVLRVMLQ
ncbi:sodium/potassium/calcium exchanger 1-like [Toxotes jaculatrix]|uniref:sodium/potassium/calcium exchanger 1-like n=1 Tax=Toxotes jaculatrix TaxID=941984 RepID=UPI001B3A8252|nr:sodium/potassium/calcium exchanger 1-like [Toxotes jaculatrix]